MRCGSPHCIGLWGGSHFAVAGLRDPTPVTCKADHMVSVGCCAYVEAAEAAGVC